MDEFATRLSNELHIRVVNTTNLVGTFAIGFNWAGPTVPPTPRGGIPRLPKGLQTALNVDLGLMLVLERNQGQAQALVVDYVELPAILEQTKTATN